MAISSFNKNNNGKKRQVISDINITPFVDVLLVLLIIFMIAAPLMNSSINLDLPKGVATNNNQKEQSFNISLKVEGTLFLQDKPIKLAHLTTELIRITNNNFDSKIHIRADKKLDYGRVMEIVKIVNMAGFSQVVLVTEVEQ